MAKKYQDIFAKGSLIKDRGLLQHEQIKSQITVLGELESLIPPLREDEALQLENNILKEGCRESLLVWDHQGQYILVDGHNRFRICQKHQIDFKVSLMNFDTMHQVKDWMVGNQLGRRNLTSEQASYLRGMRYELEKKEKGGFDKVQSKGQNDLLTSERLANEYNVSEKTIKRDAAYAQGMEKIGEANPQLKKEILSGKVKVNKEDVQSLSKMQEALSIHSADDIAKLAKTGAPKSYHSIDPDEKARQIEFIKHRIQELLSSFGQGSHEVYELLRAEVQKLGKLV